MRKMSVISDLTQQVVPYESVVRVRITPSTGDHAYVLDCTQDDVSALIEHARKIGKQGRPKRTDNGGDSE